MHRSKLIPRLVGTLFITGTLAGIASAALTGPVFGSSDYLTAITANETQVILGSIAVLIMAFSLAMIPIVLFPTFKKYNEILAHGAILFRGALEAFAYIAVAVTWLLLIGVSQDYTAGVSNAASLETLGSMLRGMESWYVHIIAIVFSIGALMIYWLFYVSRLIPRWLSTWGLVGAVLYISVPLLAILGIEGFDVLLAPLAVQEMVLAVWLLVKGFNANPAPVMKTER